MNDTKAFFRRRGVVMVPLTLPEAEAVVMFMDNGSVENPEALYWARHKLRTEMEAVQDESAERG